MTGVTFSDKLKKPKAWIVALVLGLSTEICSTYFVLTNYHNFFKRHEMTGYVYYLMQFLMLYTAAVLTCLFYLWFVLCYAVRQAAVVVLNDITVGS